MIRRVSVGLVLWTWLSSIALAHEIRPAYLEINETAVGHYSVLWKVPAAGNKRLALYVRMPDACKAQSEPFGTFGGGAYYERWNVYCEGGLADREITIAGLRTSLTDVLARVAHADGATQVTRLTSQSPDLFVVGTPTTLDVAKTYFILGVEHILIGIDHLLFVLVLMLLIRDQWMLVKTITAFTVAHSITLGGAALGVISLPQKPVEAVIALSIAFVARELVCMQPGEKRLSQSSPWVVAFAFGLLHGFGFAGVLKEIGLPQTDVAMALLTFNLGVEAGQLLFVAGLLVAYRATIAVLTWPLEPARVVAAYVVGTIATYWLVTRIADFWS
jgi:hydrogenase/urease accessory protein HupE